MTRLIFALVPRMMRAALLAPLLVGAPAVAHAAEELTVTIGHAAPLTGHSAHLGKDLENGARLAVEEINASGLLVGGRKVRLVLRSEDDAADPKTGTQIAQRLVDAKVAAVVGHLNSGVSIPAARVYNDANVVQLSPASTNPAFTQQGFPNTFRLVATDAQMAPALAQYSLGALGAKTVAIVDDSTAYGKGLADEYEREMKKGGARVVAREATNDKATAFKILLTRLKGKKPDVILFGGVDTTAGMFVRQAAELGMQIPILGGDGACTDKLAELAGTASRYFVCTASGKALGGDPKGEALARAYRARFGYPMGQYAPFSYDAVYVLVDAIQRAGTAEPMRILAAMPATRYKGVTGRIAFDEKGDLKTSTVTVYGFKSGERSPLLAIVL